MSSWHWVSLGDLAADERSAISKPYGSAIFKEDYRDHGVPVVRGVNLSKGVFHDADFVFIDYELAAKMPGAEMRPGDLVVTHRGTVGQVSMIPRSSRFKRYVASTSHVKVRLDPTKAVPEFYYYWFAGPQGQHSILSNVSTVGVPGLAQPVATVKKLQVPWPRPAEQRAIAEVLVALDDKIAANERVLTRIDGLLTAEYEGALQAGHQALPLEELATFHNHRRIPLSSREREARQGNIPYYGAAGRLDFVNEALFDQTLVLVGEDGSVVNDFGSPVVQYIWGPSWVNNHAHVLTGNGIATETLRCALSRSNVTHLVTGAVQPKISMGNLKKLVLRIPLESARFDEVAENFSAVTRSVSDENNVLARTRDELLPLLMSGKVRVKDTESAVNEVL
ncbi:MULTISPECIES: restriction endonuclease subunit S [Mycobacterium avium complex (MAC)]|jgi:type I restriction enzyme S subunit|uniref:Restriction endonuclease subunit S n=2 Tax=Mycobacterium avium complex (MAC) TaxID=120793 RepID=A0AAW5S601_MYCBC|nr:MULTISPECIES: restriction endonuclease subunit S [Mycobacterium avium complex (MAC)]KBR60033.1 hypothetical protein X425_03902 [Mycobacterium avium XTB13-223]MBZ4506042.1 restriction endonuclease subunit S [Mycobacterium avium subsp. hominissuis]MBZ4517191.1 restriction endonuclease subunit S [Mycobacterium avium subsp. hominissuis]MBZ4527043.1 restriction endonuclease subunit S [Mycobacterium avium subsp. hominissuis]MBZ4546398.1 restriction endonuclease subunit S [Mycobacterium avium subs